MIATRRLQECLHYLFKDVPGAPTRNKKPRTSAVFFVSGGAVEQE
jgi:hypothetical protein